MPIRTDHGRGAVARQAFTWPLRSRRHLAATAAATAAVVWGVSTAVGAISGHDAGEDRLTTLAAPSWTPEPTTANSVAPPLAPSTPPPVKAAPSASLDESPGAPTPSTSRAKREADPALAAADEFVRHWVRPAPGTTSEQWRAALTPYVVPEMVQALASVDPGNVPASKVTGRAKKVSQDGPHASVGVPTDAGQVRVVVLRQHDGRWLVSEWEPEAN